MSAGGAMLGYCASHLGVKTVFCEDFDTGALGALWDTQTLDGGDVALSSDSLSVPFGGAFTIRAAANRPTAATFETSRTDSGAPMAALSLAVKLSPSCRDSTANGNMSLFDLTFRSYGDFYKIAVGHDVQVLMLFLFRNGQPTGSYYGQHDISSDAWMNISLVVNEYTASLRMNDSGEITSGLGGLGAAVDQVQLHLGPSTLSGWATDCTATFDDVLLEKP